jgi:hypothetical protein
MIPETTMDLLMYGNIMEILLNSANLKLTNLENLTVTKLLTETLLTTKNFKTKTTTGTRLLMTMVLLTHGKERVISHKLPQAGNSHKLKTKELNSTYKDNTDYI